MKVSDTTQTSWYTNYLPTAKGVLYKTLNTSCSIVSLGYQGTKSFFSFFTSLWSAKPKGYDLSKPDQLIVALKKNPYRVLYHILFLMIKNRPEAKKILLNFAKHPKSTPKIEEINELFEEILLKGMKKNKQICLEMPEDMNNNQYVELCEKVQKTLNAGNNIFREGQAKYVSLVGDEAKFLEVKEESSVGSVLLTLFQKANLKNLKSENLYNRYRLECQNITEHLLKEKDLEELPQLKTLLKSANTILKQTDWHLTVGELVDAHLNSKSRLRFF